MTKGAGPPKARGPRPGPTGPNGKTGLGPIHLRHRRRRRHAHPLCFQFHPLHLKSLTF